MMKYYKLLSMIILALLMSACAQPHLTWHQAMELKIKKYALPAEQKLGPYFAMAGVSYPPRQLALLVFKQSRRLEIYAKNLSSWKYIRSFPVLAASGGPGPKLHEGDDQVPEGIYHIVGLNPESHFDLSMHLNYPNAFDRRHAQESGRKNLGGDIYIHGNQRSIGCVAIGNYAIQQVFPLVYKTGINNVTVIIAPNDFRVEKPVRGRVHPKWLPLLYAKIQRALAVFPEPKV